jgi:hypothetical protein
VKHYASPDFWACYRSLPARAQEAAAKAYELLKTDPGHPSLHFKKLDTLWSARVDRKYRALAVKVPDGYLWFWIGTHAEYDDLVR